jgi:hypothetical protein
LLQTIDIAEYRVTKRPDVVLANLGGIHRTANPILHAADIHSVFDPRNPFTLFADCPAWSVGVFLAFDGFVVRSKSMNVLDKVIVRNKRVSPWVRPGNYERGGSRKGVLQSDAQAHSRIVRGGIVQFVGDPRGLKWSPTDLHRIPKNQEKNRK